MQEITTDQLKAKIEAQKRQALFGTVHVLTTPNDMARVEKATRAIGAICENPAQFQVHEFGPSKNLAVVAKSIAAACPRVLVVAVCDLTKPGTAQWLKMQLPQLLAPMPFADAFYVDVNKVSTADRPFYESCKAVWSPTVLIWKMGHLVETFNPGVSEGGTMQEQLAERNAKIAADPKNQPNVDIDAILHRGTDTGRDAYEQREWARKEQERRNEEIAKRRERARVKALIDQQRRDRRDRM